MCAGEMDIINVLINCFMIVLMNSVRQNIHSALKFALYRNLELGLFLILNVDFIINILT